MTILCYHEVDAHWQAPMAVEPAAFTAHCEWLAAHRTVLPLDEAVRRLDRSGRLPRGCVALTFDDGFAGLYEHAFPTLRRLRLPATVFLVAATLTPEGRAVDWVDFPPPFPLVTLTAEQVAEMQEAGVAFGSHSLTHANLTDLTHENCRDDLSTSRELLEQLLGVPVPFLAYPRGRHDESVRTAAREAGYRHAFSLPETHEAVGPFAIPRVGVYRGNSVTDLRIKCMRAYLPVRALVSRRLVGRAPRSRAGGQVA